ncbi:MAG: decaprenyl-phosphate phosphoribosyltransferase [Candidatus Omnitrophica bacterium]|nr:decaprenyl-phosphate phosphoribosyltransferase [Candidatus Omnitrophota bacterium]
MKRVIDKAFWLFILARPKEWIKNSFALAPLVFSMHLTDLSACKRAVLAIVALCAASSFGYVLNDYLDRKSDAQHPIKKGRPIPAGRIRTWEAVAFGLALFVLAEFVAFGVDPLLGWVVNAYFVLTSLYSAYLKRKVIVDVLTIGCCFVLRVLAGGVAIGVVVSQWLVLCTFLLAIFLGFSKRRHELTQLGDSAREHRWVLTLYSKEFLDQMNLVTITLTLTCYIFYTISPETVARFGTTNLLYSVLIVMFGLFRYLFLVHKKGKGSPTEVLYTDRQIVVIVLLWTLYMILAIYTVPAIA